MLSGDDWDGVFNVSHVLVSIWVLLEECLSLLISFNGLPDGSLGGSLAQFSEICSCESLGQLGEELKGDVGGNGTLSQDSLQHTGSGWLVWEGDVDQLVETTRSDEGLIEDVRSVGSSNEEEVLLDTDSVHLSEQLVQHSVSCSTCISLRASSGCSN